MAFEARLQLSFGCERAVGEDQCSDPCFLQTQSFAETIQKGDCLVEVKERFARPEQD